MNNYLFETCREQFNWNKLLRRSVHLVGLAHKYDPWFDVCGFVHPRKIFYKINQQDATFPKFITWRYLWLNMFRAPYCPLSGAYNWTLSLWFCICCRLKYVALLFVVGQNSARPRPTTLHPSTCNVCKTRGWGCSCMLLMTGGMTPEIC